MLPGIPSVVALGQVSVIRNCPVNSDISNSRWDIAVERISVVPGLDVGITGNLISCVTARISVLAIYSSTPPAG